MCKTATVSLGCIGLPLSLQFAKCGATVLGFDVEKAKQIAFDELNLYPHIL